MTEVATKDRAGEYDAIETLKPGEPVFPLQGGDPFAAKCVVLWAQLAREHALSELDGEARAALLDKATSAENVAWAMDEYRRGEVAAPVAAEDAPKAYSGVARDPERDAIALRSAACDRIYDGVAQLSDAADAVKAMGGFFDAETMLRDAVTFAGVAVRDVEPRKHLKKEAA